MLLLCEDRAPERVYIYRNTLLFELFTALTTITLTTILRMSSEQSESAFGGYSTADHQRWATTLETIGAAGRGKCRDRISEVCGKYPKTVNALELFTLEAMIDAINSYDPKKSAAEMEKKLQKVAEWQSKTNYKISFDHYLSLH